MSATLNQPLKWFGGKNYLARRIVDLMPTHLNYVEPYFGGGAVLFARDPDDERLWLPPHKGVSEVVNDLNGELTNFWRILQHSDTCHDFRRIVAAMPFSGHEFQLAQKTDIFGSDVDRAVNFFVLNRQSLGGMMKSFTGITKTRTRSRMNNEVSAWLNCIEGLPATHARLKRVLVLPPMDALAVIRKFDMSETLFYLDPPYMTETRVAKDVYAHEMTENEHRNLLHLLGGVSGKFMLSGYESALYSSFARRNNWNRHDFKLPNQAAGGKTKRVMTECLWCNF